MGTVSRILHFIGRMLLPRPIRPAAAGHDDYQRRSSLVVEPPADLLAVAAACPICSFCRRHYCPVVHRNQGNARSGDVSRWKKRVILVGGVMKQSAYAGSANDTSNSTGCSRASVLWLMNTSESRIW